MPDIFKSNYLLLCHVFRLQAHMDAVHADWKEYLNLLICEENHLKHMDEYHKVRQMNSALALRAKIFWKRYMSAF